jgi:hypothetical protein
MKIDTAQSGLASLNYSSYLDEIGLWTLGSWNSVAVDSAGAVYIAGESGQFWWWGQPPTLADPSWLLTPKDFAVGGGYTNDGQGVFVTKMDLSRPPADQVVFRSTFGGGRNIRAQSLGISLRPTGQILVYGDFRDQPCAAFTGSFGLPVCFPFVFLDPAFPPPPPPQPDPSGAFPIISFVAELSSSGDQLLFSTPLGTEPDCCQGNNPHVALTSSGEFFVGMQTTEAGRASANAFQFINAGDMDIFLFSLVRTPVANPQSVFTDMDQPIDIVLTGSDPQGDPLSFAVLTQPANGFLYGTEPNVTYVPNQGFLGTDTFEFVVTDGRFQSAPATVTIRVRGLADLQLLVYAPSAVSVTETFLLSVTIWNWGPHDAADVTFAGLGTLAGFTGMQIYPSQGTCTGSLDTLIDCALGTIPAGQNASFFVWVSPTPAVFPSPNVTSVSVPWSATVSTSDTDTDTTNNTSSGAITVTTGNQPLVVTPPPDAVVAATEMSGARGNVSPALHAFLLSGSATDPDDPNPQRLPPQVNGVDADDMTLFPIGLTVVTFRYQDAAGNIGSATAEVSVQPPVGASTPAGSNVSVQPTDLSGTPQPITLNFGQITQPGLTTATPSLSGPAPPADFLLKGLYYDITTTALYTPPIVICFNGSFMPGDLLSHYENGAWVVLPNQQLLPPGGPPFNALCAQTSSLSPFAVLAPANHPPTASAGADQTVEATGASGASVTLSGSGSDPDGDPLTFNWSGPCGSASGARAVLTCPLGWNVMTLMVDDGRGGTATSSVNINVVDTTPPVLSLPAGVSATATSSAGALVNFSASASDIVDGALAPACSPASGSTFPIGSTTVNCTATDARGNSASASFAVTVSVGTPRLTGSITGKGRDASGNYFVDLRVKNTGTGHARDVRITSITFRTLAGSGTVSLDAALTGALPLLLGDLDIGAFTTLRLYLTLPSTVTRFSISEGGKVRNVAGTPLNFSMAQAVTP